jgi:hypothetical protein
MGSSSAGAKLLGYEADNSSPYNVETETFTPPDVTLLLKHCFVLCYTDMQVTVYSRLDTRTADVFPQVHIN